MVARLIEESIKIDATPERAWSVISDLRRMGEWSPQCKKMLLRAPVKLDTRTVNINRRGPLLWPTTAKVVQFESNKRIGWRVAENHTVWSYEIVPDEDGGITVVHRREAPTGKTTAVSSFLVDKVFGGNDSFEAELKVGMAESLGRIKRAVEA